MNRTSEEEKSTPKVETTEENSEFVLTKLIRWRSSDDDNDIDVATVESQQFLADDGEFLEAKAKHKKVFLELAFFHYFTFTARKFKLTEHVWQISFGQMFALTV